MQVIKVKNGQNILDIAVQYCGSVDSAWDIAQANDLPLSASLVNGQELNVPDVSNKEVVNYMRVGEYYPATAKRPAVAPAGEGIGFWAIGEDFEVQ